MWLRSLSLRGKLILISLAAVVVTTAACLTIQHSIIRKQGIDLTRTAMRGIVLGAECQRQSLAALHQDQAFRPDLPDTLKQVKDYRDAIIYRTVPVVAAWRSITEVAKTEGYTFHVVANSPRNPDHRPTPDEVDGLARVEHGLDEDFYLNATTNEMVYVRPIRLTRDCIICHGDPATSPTHDGKDIVGMPMENWKEGQVHGAFVLRSSLDRLSPVIRASVQQTILWVLPVALVVGLVIYYLLGLLTRRLDQLAAAVSESSETVDDAAHQVAGASNLCAKNAADQATSLKQTSASSEQISSMAKLNAEHSREAASLAAHSQQRSADANQSLQHMVKAMEEIDSQSAKISRIIKVVDDIAFQTNILALNASVEAARAGEAGAGFAVVANEVRGLAQRCAEAARETSTLIEESIAKSGDGRLKVDQVVQVIRAMSDDAVRVKALVEQVRTGSEEQDRGIGQISQAMTHMQSVTQCAAASSAQTADAASKLNAQAGSLKVIVAGLNELLGSRH